ncbi:stage III sporulation protein AE [Texcoconibacillus texcoconensis]|uniref:Stage III sporulation protein AE n=1 Tax=Texcoconibacillus texcoconensis TaxID=1095777 RepID=A0A840QNY2_9BACI|nr:stage III sporulation protein AE [Texcoconibacillus texcoconensis]MBB5173079.1 stage III sporulation protein AE [Texcoconibacillus texcoconensis]
MRVPLLFVLGIAMIVCLFPGNVQAVDDATDTFDEEGMVEEQLEDLGLEEVEQFWEEVVNEYGGFFPEIQRGSFMEFVRGDQEFSPKEWGLGFVRFAFHEIIVHGQLLGTLILLAIFSLILRHLQNAFEKHTISKVAYAITYLILLSFVLNSFHVAIDFTMQTVDTMTNFMIALMPILLVIMATLGGVTSVALFHPLIIFLVQTSGLFVQYFVLPLLFLSALLSIVSTMSDHYKLTKLSSFLRNIAVGGLAVFLTMFLGVISVQGAATAVADGIAVRTAKFVTGNFVPVVGRMFTDAADTVMGASVLLKNTVGVVGLVLLLLICAFPAIKVLAIAFIYSFSSAIIQPLGDGPLIKVLSEVGKSMLFIFASLATVSLMFFLVITVVVISGNLSLMIR